MSLQKDKITAPRVQISPRAVASGSSGGIHCIVPTYLSMSGKSGSLCCVASPWKIKNFWLAPHQLNRQKSKLLTKSARTILG